MLDRIDHALLLHQEQHPVPDLLKILNTRQANRVNGPLLLVEHLKMTGGSFSLPFSKNWSTSSRKEVDR